jgi:hypothetical protein
MIYAEPGFVDKVSLNEVEQTSLSSGLYVKKLLQMKKMFEQYCCGDNNNNIDITPVNILLGVNYKEISYCYL